MTLHNTRRAALALALLAGTSLLAACGGSEPITVVNEKPPAATHAPPPQ